MAICLVALGSNLGDRAATLRAAVDDLRATPDVRVVRHSAWYSFPSLGGPAGQADFLNGAALLETALEPRALYDSMLRIESRHGRRRTERWSARPLDIDLLLYDDRIVDTRVLTIPHPRMSFRRFVLVPAAEIAPQLVHPSIGWTIDQLHRHLDTAQDRAAIVSPSHLVRRELSERLVADFGGHIVEPPPGDEAVGGANLWPPSMTAWLTFTPPSRADSGDVAPGTRGFEPPYPIGSMPKLTILVDPPAEQGVDPPRDWSMTRRQPGRGPTLLIEAWDRAEIVHEVTAAIEAVWPDLGPNAAKRIQ